MEDFAAFVGWDWADREHEIRLQEVGTERIEKKKIRATAEALHEWAAEMRRRFGGRLVGVGIETSRGAVIWALMSYAHIVLYPINPKSVARFRETFNPSGKKDDGVDAEAQLELVVKHRDKLRPLKPADAETRSLAILSEHRRRLVHDLVRETHRLRANLKSYFPQALTLAGALDTVMACDFLGRWWSLASLQRSSETSIRDFYRKHGSRATARIQDRLDVIRRAVPLTTDEAVVASGIEVTRTLVIVIRSLLKAVAELDERLESIYANHLEHDLLASFPGLGPILGSRMAALLGSDRDRFDSRESLQRITGVAPVTKRTGGSDGPITVHRRVRRSKFLHQTIVEWAGASLSRSQWARAFYDQQRARGVGRWSTLRALGYKWVRILFRCWQSRTSYDEARYIAALRKSGSSLVSLLAA